MRLTAIRFFVFSRIPLRPALKSPGMKLPRFNRILMSPVLEVIAALVLCLAVASSSEAATKSGTKAKDTSGKSATESGLAALLAPKVPEGGQSVMNWQGLNLASQIGSTFGNAGTAQEPAWRPVTAPGMKAPAPGNARTEASLPDGWTFIPIALATGQLEKPRTARVPDRWPKERDYVAGWYVKRVTLSPREGERIVARFEQVALFCVLYVNGVECGRHLGSYTPFQFDLTGAARPGENVLALYVHDGSGGVGAKKLYNQIADWKPQNNEPYMGGIWNPMRLERRPAAYVGDVFVKTSTRRQELTLVCELENAGPQPQAARLEFALFNWPDGSPVSLALPARSVSLTPGQTETLTVTVPWAHPELWSPDHPHLYVVRATLQTPSDRTARADCLDTRFGFREFWAEGQKFMLNGVPTRLFGESHFSGSGDRERNRAAFLNQKERYRANAYRIHAQIQSGNIELGADEAGCLLIDQSSIWSISASRYRNGGEPFLANTRREFAEWVRRDRNSPSVVIWDVENEQLRMGENNQSWALKLDAFVRAHDNTRLIEHSGGGWYAPDAQIIHLHDEEQFIDIMERWRARETRPLIMGEWWVGFQGGEFRLTSSREFRSQPEYTLEEALQDEEELLQMRNFGVSGIMPFQISRAVPPLSATGTGASWAKQNAARWFGTNAAACAQAIHHGLQPLTVFFWPRGVSAAAGGELKRELVVCNDAETARALTAEWSLAGAPPQEVELNLAPGEQRRIPISLTVPAQDCRLVARLLAGGKLEASEELNLRVAEAVRLAAPALQRKVIVYEGAHPGTVEKLKGLGITATASAQVPAQAGDTLWLIAPGASDPALNGQSAKIRQYLEAGGRLLCLAQGQWPRWSPVPMGFVPATRSSPWYYMTFGVPKAGKDLLFSCYAPIYAAGHPAFDGITASDLRLWSPRDGRVSDDALLRPAAAEISSAGSWRILAGAYRPELASLAEARVGQGTLVFCQAQVLEQSQTPEARLVLMNLLRYLDGPGWAGGSGRVSLAGALTTAKASALSGARAEVFTGAAPERGDVLIATDGADPGQLATWAEAGGTVLVLSAEVARRLPGYAAANKDGVIDSGAHGQDHPLLWGVSQASFMGIDHPCVEGVLTKTPPAVKVLVHGLAAKASAVKAGFSTKGNQEVDMYDAAPGPVAVAQAQGKGQWVVTTLAPWRGQNLHDGELMRNLLANAGVVLPVAGQQSQAVQVLKTVPLKIDGQLDDWTSDVDDRNVSPYVHANPIVLPAQDATGGQPMGDADLSSIVYFLWNEQALYLGGVVFGQGGAATVRAHINGHVLSFIPAHAGDSLQIDGKPARALHAANGHTTSDDLTDARALAFVDISNKAGASPRLSKVPGTTFEIEAPWGALGWTRAPGQFAALLRLERADGVAISSPALAAPKDPATWLKLSLVP